MSAIRDRPYAGFNFLVDFGIGGSPTASDAGFEQCGPLAEAIEVIEYRNGNASLPEPVRIPGVPRPAEVTLRRGVIGTATLYTWLDQIRASGSAAARDVTITLLAEDHATQVAVWRLSNAWPVRYSAGPLNGTASAIAVEELTLTCERLELSVPGGG